MEYLRRYWHILVGIICVIVLGTVYLVQSNSNAPLASPMLERTVIAGPEADITNETTPLAVPTPPTEEVLPDIVVHIEGAVVNPGVYTMPYGSRVNDVLNMAGGAKENADLARVNLAAFLQDAQQIVIPLIGEDLVVAADSQNVSTSGGGGLININTATATELTTLPGVGAVTAGNIISYRENNGPFTTIEQLQNVPRIGPAIMANLRELITVG